MQLWCFSQFAGVEMLVTSLTDEFHQDLVPFLKRKEVLVLVVCTVQFLLGIPCVLQVQFIAIFLVNPPNVRL